MSVFNSASAIGGVKGVAFIAVLLLTFALAGCNRTNNQLTGRADGGARIPAPPPRIEASPVAEGGGNWRVLTAQDVMLTVTAPGARQVKLLYSPVVADDQAFEIATLDASEANETFKTRLEYPADFAGEVWAEVAYADGAMRQTEPLSLVAREAIPIAAEQNEQSNQNTRGGEDNNSTDARAGGGQPIHALNTSGGTVTHNRLQADQPDVRIAINIPAFRLTLWQGGRPVKTYEIGIGKKSHPLPSGERQTTQVIFNPNWIPPNSAWVRRMRGVNPGERITASDPRNPLGNIKIPLGGAYLIHEAAKPSDIGALVSHGCARVLQDDLFDLANNLLTARGRGLSEQQLAELRRSSERRIENFDAPVPVEISYETQVVENNTLYLYPDVYDRNTNTVERLRELLRAHGVDADRLDDAKLRELLQRPNANERFVVALEDIGRGRALEQRV